MIKKILSYLDSTNQNSIKDNKYEDVKSLGRYGGKIIIDLNDCDIIENSYFEEVENYNNSKISTLNYLSGNEMRNFSRVNIIYSVIVYRRVNPLTNEEEKFVSDFIPKDKFTLAMFASKARFATIYYDTNNIERYYFDLRELVSLLS